MNSGAALVLPSAMDFIVAECLTSTGVETGGAIVAVGSSPGVSIRAAGSPGPRAVRRPRACQWDAEHVGAWLATEMLGPCTAVGRWHKHCGPVLTASDTDREGAWAMREALGVESILDLIVATEDDVPIAWALYHCAQDAYVRIAERLAL